jgi:hypothetical protein
MNNNKLKEIELKRMQQESNNKSKGNQEISQEISEDERPMTEHSISQQSASKNSYTKSQKSEDNNKSISSFTQNQPSKNKLNTEYGRFSLARTNTFSGVDENNRKFLKEKEKRERDFLNNKVKETRERRLKGIIGKILGISESIIKNKIKYTDFTIAFFIIINVLLVLYSNHKYTSSERELICGATNSTTVIINPNDCSLNYTNTIKEEYTVDKDVRNIRWIIIGIICVIELLLMYSYRLKIRLLRAAFRGCAADNIFTTGLWKMFFAEFILLGVLSPPGLDGVFRGRMLFGAYIYSYDSLITLAVLLKLYYYIKVYGHISMWTSDRIRQIGANYKISIGTAFAIKAQLKHSPYISMTVMFAVCIGIFGFMMRIFEYGFTADPGAALGVKAVKNPNFKTYSDTFWVIIITMMTVGYGDIYPNTHLGRVIAFLSALTGMLIVSLLIISLSYMVEFSPKERKAHNLIKKLEAGNEMKKISSTLVKSVMKLYLMKVSDYYLYEDHNDKK